MNTPVRLDNQEERGKRIKDLEDRLNVAVSMLEDITCTTCGGAGQYFVDAYGNIEGCDWCYTLYHLKQCLKERK